MSMQYGAAASRPVRLVGGRWRRIARRWRLFVALVPVLAPVLAVLGLVHVFGPAVWVAVGALAGVLARPWWNRVRVAWWRLRWPWDARAGGLCRFAERGVDLSYDGLDEWSLETVPALIRVRVDGNGVRRYLIRPLPGSTRLEMELAAEVLRTRWRAVSVQAIADPSGTRWSRGRVELVVITGSAVAHPIELPDDDAPAEELPGFVAPPPVAIGAAAGLIVAAAAGGYGRGPVLALVVVFTGAAAWRLREAFALLDDDDQAVDDAPGDH